MNQKKEWLTWKTLFQSLGGAMLVLALSAINGFDFLLDFEPTETIWLLLKSSYKAMTVVTDNGAWIIAATGFCILATGSLNWSREYIRLKMFTFLCWPLAILFAPWLYGGFTGEKKIYGNFAATGATIFVAFMFAIFQ